MKIHLSQIRTFIVPIIIHTISVFSYPVHSHQQATRLRFDQCHPTAQLLPHDAADESSYTGTQHQQVVTGGVFAWSLRQFPAVLIG